MLSLCTGCQCHVLIYRQFKAGQLGAHACWLRLLWRRRGTRGVASAHELVGGGGWPGPVGLYCCRFFTNPKRILAALEHDRNPLGMKGQIKSQLRRTAGVHVTT